MPANLEIGAECVDFAQAPILMMHRRDRLSCGPCAPTLIPNVTEYAREYCCSNATSKNKFVLVAFLSTLRRRRMAAP
jgi:hypothetical protein